ncbi:hypothetical protein WICANDRAFT_65680 [Wickerhamomyces anomalus NRRL Y-366-8]|uniref:Protein Zds1 C-terminal domain-containing protein n=1 Tax=Wickerhamomyces anomalus (strain ATCC 58044 / CBS 1984 / NCYC 433 / NRRL Y-366-8) TaxID=683960 RepID=A0A1E3NUT8_WICAA|nr:uncharacterized protein WICANDRAFT_65680 [Wickerhamomyces anomalus NRRL Y-366-8]ODQ56800.1 hypothetical protein WICANDRAFT_65680 [Wickerhamomyces anomalus NRRL Y-366-8]
MSDSNTIGDSSSRDFSSSPSPTSSSTQLLSSAQITRRQSQKSQDELKKAKRKSNAYMAAEAVQHEREAVTALKRLSIGRSSINIDPDLPFGVDGDFNYNDYNNRKSHHRRKSSQDSSSSSTTASSLDDREKTLIDDQDDSTSVPQGDEEDEHLKLNAEKLLWVPAKSHPSIAPDQFRRHVQSTIDDMNNQLGDRSPVHSLSTRDSIPSLKELTDELDRLSEMAGLAATDAVTLARSLSSASGASGLLMNSDADRFFQESTTSPTSPPLQDEGTDRRPSQEDIDQDAPILSDGSSSLKRNKWTTYSRSNRLGKDKLKKSPKSPLSDEHQFPSQQQQPTSPNLDKELPPSPKDAVPERAIPLQNPIEQQKLAERRGRSNLSRSQSDSLPKRTNHSRNRHAGSLITMENDEQKPHPQHKLPEKDNHHYQRRVVSNDSYPKTHSNLHQVQQRPQLSPKPLQPTPSKEHHKPEQVVAQQPEKTKKDNSFLKMFKKKRSPSPKNQKTLDSRDISSSKQFTNDENHPPSPQESQFPQNHYHQQQSTPSASIQNINHQPSQPHQKRPSLRPSRTSTFKFTKQSKSETKEKLQKSPSKDSKLQESVKIIPQKKDDSAISPTSASQQSSFHQQTGQATNEEQHRIQKETLSKKLSIENMKKSTKPNAPVQFTDSAFGFPLPPLSNSTIIMLDYRFPIHVERALYRLSHLKLANPRRPLRQQVLLSNFMYAYLNLVNHTLYLQQLDENGGNEEDQEQVANADGIDDQEQINIEV